LQVAGSPTFDWQYHTEDAARLGHDVPVPRGRVIGGSSAVNAAVAMRARPADFARWAKRGIEGWSREEVLTAYKALENTPTGDDACCPDSRPRTRMLDASRAYQYRACLRKRAFEILIPLLRLAHVIMNND
jgi:choline dehydrogenase-like flavoprotein